MSEATTNYTKGYPLHHMNWRLTLFPVVLELLELRYDYLDIAKALNRVKFRTLAGNQWTADNVRKVHGRHYTSSHSEGHFNYGQAMKQHIQQGEQKHD